MSKFISTHFKVRPIHEMAEELGFNTSSGDCRRWLPSGYSLSDEISINKYKKLLC